MPKHPGGRPTRLTPEVQERVIEAARMGGTLSMMAAAGGIAEDTLKEWLARGEGRTPGRPCTPLYQQFAHEVTQAKDLGCIEMLACVRAAASGAKGFKGDWRAAQFLLSVRHAEFAKVTVNRLTGADGGSVKVEHSNVDAEIERLVAEMGQREQAQKVG